MTERQSTGIDGLDAIVEGGFPQGATVLLLGEPGVGKSTFCNQFMGHGLDSGQGGLFIALDDAPDSIMEEADGFGWDFDDSDELVFMDAYSWRLGEEVDGEYTVQGPSDLNQLNMTLTDALRAVEAEEKRLVIDSASTLVLYTDPQSAVKFLQVVSAKSQAKNGVLLMTVEEGVQEEQTVSKLNYVADGVVEFKQEDGDRFLSVSRMAKTSHSQDWHRFEITDDGIEIVE